ncbi:hypothetical protein [uncultured Litoreibacter sp.]|uniref:hypothetical protein n=1 Tax=uncultured Litoreibacter sp. TaxID=1392394 RepID=UPI00262273CE|nr:hypothetical protein [uncultured Litoreibacter sp.]
MAQDYSTDALGPFREYAVPDVPLEALSRKQFQCPQDPNLYPTHPAQDNKTYHVGDRARYNARELDARDEECVLSQIGDRRPGAGGNRSQAAIDRVIRRAEETGRRIPCQQADVVLRYVLSDTYIDACGNYYRGVKALDFLGSYENMGTLFSPGRVQYRVPGSQFKEYYAGQTYAVKHTDFLFLADLLPGDMEKINRGRTAAQSTHTLDGAGRIFTYTGPHR